jgi:hypothetical protein
VGASESTEPVAYFVHVMKAGGTSLRWMLLESVLEPEELFPHKTDGEELEAHDLVLHHINPFRAPELFTAAPPVRVVSGHYPYLAKSVIPRPVITLSVFRDPVDRVVSHLRHIQRDDHPNRSYEELYDDPELFDPFFYNLQARAFAFDDQDAKSLMVRTFDWDDEHLERAKRNVEELDVIGLTSEFGEFAHNLESVFGWRFDNVYHSHRTPRHQSGVPRKLRKRIHDDLIYDRRFYEHVVSVYESRGALRSADLARS